MTGWVVAVPVVATSLGAAIGGLIVHVLALKREALSLRRVQRVEYLVAAYRRLIAAANRFQELSPERVEGLEAALSDVMLLGEGPEIDAVREFQVDMARDGNADLEPVLTALRASLRAEIGLAALPMPRPYNLRMGG